MPPKSQPGLPEKQREQITTWFAGMVRDLETAPPTDPGPSVPRRVTRREYRNLVRDLFDVDVDVDTYLPSPHSASGYDNQASQLAVSPELLEKYLLLAERVVDAAFPNIYNTRQKEPIKGWFAAWEGEKGLKARAAAELNLRQLTRLAFRRPASEQEVAILLGLFDRAFAAKKGFHESLRFAVKGLLVSPQFLFRVESLPADGKTGPGGRLRAGLAPVVLPLVQPAGRQPPGERLGGKAARARRATPPGEAHVQGAEDPRPGP